MRVIKTALREVYGLFVEDGSYALAVILWLLCAVFVLPLLPDPGWRAPLLFAGSILILLENVVRSAKH
jgi:hypothetical protein